MLSIRLKKTAFTKRPFRITYGNPYITNNNKLYCLRNQHRHYLPPNRNQYQSEVILPLYRIFFSLSLCSFPGRKSFMTISALRQVVGVQIRMGLLDILIFMMTAITLVCLEIILGSLRMASCAAHLVNFIERPFGMRVILRHPCCLNVALFALTAEIRMKFLYRDVFLMADIARHTIGEFRMIGILDFLGGLRSACPRFQRSRGASNSY